MRPRRLKIMTICSEHPKRDQNPKFTPLSETTTHMGVPLPWEQDILYTFYSGICNVKFSTESGTIMSPNYPQKYPNSVKCEWIIDLSPRYEITLTFHEFMLESQRDCSYDWLTVQEGNNADAPIVFRGCSDILPPDMVISGPARITFKTDGNTTLKGFHITWAAKG